MQEHSQSEDRSYNRHFGSRRDYLQDELNGIDFDFNEKKRRENYQKRREEQGNGRYISDGSKDRLDGVRYQDDKYPNRDDQQSYFNGYYVHGNRAMAGRVYNLEKLEAYKIALALGCRDRYFLGIPEEKLGDLKNYASYMRGYNDTLNNTLNNFLYITSDDDISAAIVNALNGNFDGTLNNYLNKFLEKTLEKKKGRR